MEQVKKKDKKLIFLLAAIVICAILCLGGAVGFRERRSGTLDEVQWQQTDEGGYEMQGFQLGMAEGEYTLKLSYDSEDELSYRIVDMQRNDGENELGLEIASGTFPEDSPEVSVDFVLEESAGKLTLYLLSENGITGSGEWELETRSGAYADFLLLFLCTAAGVIFLYYFRDWKKNKEILILVATAVFITLPYLTGYQQNGDDLYFHLSRIRGMAGALSTGQFPVRLNTDFAWGYGFASSIMYPELFLYIPAVLYLLGVSLIASYKFLILCINIGTVCLGFYSFRRLLRSDKLGAIVTLLYLTNPYRLINIFQRAAVGEILAQMFLPLLLYGVYELIFGNAKKWWVAVLAATGILQSHILSVGMSLLFCIGIFLAGLVYMTRHDLKERLLSCAKACIMSIGINLWFLIPFFDHFRDDFVIQNQVTDLQERAVDIYTMFRINMQLQGPSYDTGVLREEFVSIGAVVLLGSVIYLYYAYIRHTVEKRLKSIGTACLCVGALCCYMASRAFPWAFIQEYMPGLYKVFGTVQFAWRFLAYAALLLSITAGIALWELVKEKREWAVAVLVGLAIFMTFSCMDQFARSSIFIASRSEVQNYDATWFDYYASDTDPWEIIDQGDTVKASDNIEITSYKRHGVELSFDYSGVTDPCALRLPIYDYGMYEIYLNGERIDPAVSENHQLTLTLTEDNASGHIEVRYREEMLYKAGDCVSLLLIAALGFVCAMRKGRNNGKRKSITGHSVL